MFYTNIKEETRPSPFAMRILSWNVNGIRAATRKGFANWLKEDDPDILCIQEIKAMPEQVDEEILKPEGYHAIWNPAERKGYSGTLIYSKTKPTSTAKGIGIERFDVEGRVVQADYPEFTLLNVYFPNGRAREERLQYKMEFYDAFLEHIDTLVRSGRNVIFCGDVNTAHNPIDLAHPKRNEKISGFLRIERDWLDKVLQHGYVDTFRNFHPDKVKYSWWDYRNAARERNMGWRLDYFIANAAFLPRVRKAFIMNEVMGSDHCPVGIEVDV
jgi:exodeoxyribonuclease-3